MKHPYYLPETKEEDTNYFTWFESDIEKELFRVLALNYIYLSALAIRDCGNQLTVDMCKYHINHIICKLTFKISNKDIIDTSIWVIDQIKQFNECKNTIGGIGLLD